MASTAINKEKNMQVTKERFDYIVRYSNNLDQLIENLSIAKSRLKYEINKPTQDTVLINSAIISVNNSLETFMDNRGNK
jgi:hypothetical protein